MRRIKSFAVCLAAALVCANAAQAQETRVEALRQARDEKQQNATPYEPSLLEKTLTAVESGRIPLITGDGIYLKLGSLTTGSGFAYGAGYRTSRLFDRDAALDLWGGVSAKGYWASEARLRLPHLANRRMFAEGYARRQEYPQEDYFGLGADSPRDAQSDYALRGNTFGARGGVRPTKIAMLGGGVEFLQPRIGTGTDDALPSIDKSFDAESAPGLSHTSDFVRTLAFLDIDYRRPRNARNGGWYRAELSHYADGDGGAFTFNRFDVDVRQYVGFFSERRVIFGRVFASTSDSSNGATMPFYFMPTLGGNDSLRGFRDYRFRGPHAILLQGEYRFEIWSGLDAALFYDTGQVGMRRGDLKLRDFESDYGFGFRFNTNNGVVLRVDSAFGSSDGKHLWIVFGGTF
jgi:outer membrane protein assembly factor BamA